MSVKMTLFSVTLVTLLFLVEKISGHGMMLEPPNRSSLWRFDPTAPQNPNDDRNWCGGPATQWSINGGKCGVCGDPYNDPHPEANENTGKYGQGKIVEQYSAGSLIDIQINITLNHMGTFNFTVCVLEDLSAPEPGEECFQPLLLANGDANYAIENTDKTQAIYTQVQLPEGLTCERCVLRWDYLGADIVGQCDDGTSAAGCGPQETFRSCADIAIL